jgi:hypothetical protein
MFEINDKVEFHSTATPTLDGQVGTVVGRFGEGFSIVMFDDSPDGYNPAIVIIDSCLHEVR